MVDPLIELVAHPIAGIGLMQKIEALVDQIGVIKLALNLFSSLIGQDNRRPHPKQRRCFQRNGQSFFSIRCCQQTGLFGFECLPGMGEL